VGLDNFDTDSGSGQAQGGSDSDKSETSAGSDASDGDSQAKSGLESFIVDNGGTGDNGDGGSSSSIYRETAGMSREEEIRYIRENYFDDYCPDAHLEGDIQYTELIRAKCHCGEVLFFSETSSCASCGRKYKYTGRTVIEVDAE